jgi:hypothetical protein
MRRYLTTESVWAYPNTDPMCNDPLTVGGGVSIE